MDKRQRNRLLEQLDRPSATLGRSLPETVTIDNEVVPIRDLYFALADRERLTEADRRRLEESLRYLRRKRLQLKHRLEEDEKLEYDAGEALVERIHRLDRAIDAFESVDAPELGEQVRAERIESAEELLELLRKCTV